MNNLPRFLDKVTPIPESGCWLWGGATVKGGYGVFRNEGKNSMAHRLAYEHFKGDIPKGLQLDHLCRVTCCVNPDHLEPVTAKENTLRGNNTAAQNARKTHCINGHEFNEKNTRITPNRGSRYCRVCAKERERKRRQHDEN